MFLKDNDFHVVCSICGGISLYITCVAILDGIVKPMRPYCCRGSAGGKDPADERLIVKDNHINPAKWDPLNYNFRHYFGLGKELAKTFTAEV
jgi:hypothetical protein